MAAFNTATSLKPTISTSDLGSMVKPDSVKPGSAFWRLVPSERPIWAVILHITIEGGIDDATAASDDLIRQTADDFAISQDEVRAAVAYYAKHKAYIDAWLLLNFDSGGND